MIRRLSIGIALALAIACALVPAAAHAAATKMDPLNPLVSAPASQTVPPKGFTVNAIQAKGIASRLEVARKLGRRHRDMRVKAWVWDHQAWAVDFYRGGKTYLEVFETPTGHVAISYTGIKAQYIQARMRFAGLFDSPWVFIPFGLMFLLPFVDPRRPFRLLHLDLLVLMSFFASYGVLARGHAEAGVMLVYPVLLYLLGRMLWSGLRRRTRPRGRVVPVLPTAVLVVGLVALIGARVGLNLASDKVMDIGYASVVGADRIEHQQPLYVQNDGHGDTYGPVDYLAYIPFELAFPWHGHWDYLPSAHAATLFFDLMTLLGLFLLGREMRAGPEGRRLGLALAWGWAAFPFTLLGLIMNTNDGLVAMLVVYALLFYKRSPGARGLLLGLAAAAKFFTLALLPLFASGRDVGGRRRAAQIALAGIGVFVLVFAFFIPDGGVREVWNCTLGYQLTRPPDFSIWEIYDGIGWIARVLEVLAVVLAVAVAFFPRRRSFAQLCALGAAVTIALQIPAGHWFYFYIMWFLPLVLVALFAPETESGEGAPHLRRSTPSLTWRAAEAPRAGAAQRAVERC